MNRSTDSTADVVNQAPARKLRKQVDADVRRSPANPGAKGSNPERDGDGVDQHERGLRPPRGAVAWVQRWGDTIAPTDVRGVWLRKDGGFRIRGRAVDPKSGALREVNRALPDCRKATKAAAELEAALDAIRSGGAPTTRNGMPRFADYAVDVLASKVGTGEIASAAGRQKWGWVLETHLIPHFGEWYLDKISRRDIEAWKVKIGKAGYSPNTTNTILSVLKTIMSKASDDYEDLGLADPAVKVKPFDASRHRTYTKEKTNSLGVEQVHPFLDLVRERWPERYAMVYLGMWTGLRPSSLRALRRCGSEADINWDTAVLQVRRSHTVGDEVMQGTKNGDDIEVKLSPDVLEVLRWHCERLEVENEKRRKRSPDNAAAMDASELMFPCEPNGRNRGGGFLSASSLKATFRDVSDAMKLKHRVSPRALRRSFQDLMRTAEVDPNIARATCGHRTSEMTARYSSVRADEQQAAMGKIISLAKARARSPLASPPDRSEAHPSAPVDVIELRDSRRASTP